jgi:hypothetical protein
MTSFATVKRMPLYLDQTLDLIGELNIGVTVGNDRRTPTWHTHGLYPLVPLFRLLPLKYTIRIAFPGLNTDSLSASEWGWKDGVLGSAPDLPQVAGLLYLSCAQPP